MELLLYRRSRQQWTQLLREIYRKTEELRARNQGGRIRSGRHDDIHKRILLRWDRTGRVFLGGEHLNAHATGIHRPVSGNGEDQVGRKFFSLPESQYSRLVIRSPRYIVPSFRIPISSPLFSLFDFPREKRNEEKKKKRKMAELRMRSGWWTLDGNGEGDGKGGRGGRGWLLDVSGITVRDEMKLKDSCCARRWWGGRRGGWKERTEGRENGIAGVQLIKRELYSDLVRISYARALYYVSTRHSLSFIRSEIRWKTNAMKTNGLRLFFHPPLLKSESF